MDPQATWRDLLDAWIEHDWSRLQEAATDLLNWMDRGGFPPEMLSDRQMGALWNEPMIRAVCKFADDVGTRVLADVNGIPTGLPFSLTCFDCDADGPASFEAAVIEDWTDIEFRPENLAANFLGSCPDHSN